MRNVAVEVGLKALTGLLDEFARGNIVDPKLERQGLDRHARELSERWDQRFPGFPEKYFPFTSFRGEYYRGKRDEYLKKIITQLVIRHDNAHKTIVNPACAFGRHTRDLALRLKACRVIGTDIDPNWNRMYERIRGGRNPENFEFIRDNIFDPQLDVTPTAVVFFGACGSVSDGIIDYAIEPHSPYLMCRTCCHDNIGGNTEITRRFTYLSLYFRFKNWGMCRMRRKKKYAGFYFSGKYSQAHYPRSKAARSVSNSDGFLEVSRNSVESDICRAIIDLDRYLRLVEQGYNVWYKGELFVAEKAAQTVSSTCCASRS